MFDQLISHQPYLNVGPNGAWLLYNNQQDLKSPSSVNNVESLKRISSTEDTDYEAEHRTKRPRLN